MKSHSDCGRDKGCKLRMSCHCFHSAGERGSHQFHPGEKCIYLIKTDFPVPHSIGTDLPVQKFLNN